MQRLAVIVLTFSTSWLVAAPSFGQGAASPPATERQPPPPKPLDAQARRQMMDRIFAERTLKRDVMLGALGHLGKELAAIAVDEAFRDYADAIGAAQGRLITAHFIEENGALRLSTKTNAELRAIADEFGKTYREATDRLAKELAAAGATSAVSAERVEADAYRVIAANVLQSNFDEGPPYDALRGYDAALANDELIRAAAERAAKDPTASQALEEALTSYRAKARDLGRAIIDDFGRYAFASLTYNDPSRDPPPNQEKAREQMRARRHEWRRLNDRCADDVERFLRGSGDEAAAASWRLRDYAATASSIVSATPWAQSIVDSAAALGASDEELKAMQAIVRDSLVERASKVRSVVEAYRRWQDDLFRRGEHNPFATDPPAEVLSADDRCAALDQSLRDRALACMHSALVRKDLERIPAPRDAGNFWRLAYEQRVQQSKAAPKED